MKEFKQIVKDYWGLGQKEVDFYDINGVQVEILENRKQTVEKELEQQINGQKDIIYKDIEPPGPRKVMMYLGVSNTS